MRKDYWKKRFDQIEQEANTQTVEFFHETERKYRKAIHEIDMKINAWYRRFAINNNISIAEAKKLLTSDELKELKWTIKDYIEHGQENAINGLWLKELENSSAKVHITRLEALKIDCQQSLEVATGGMIDNLDKHARNVYKNTFYRSCFEIQKGIGIGFDVAKINDRLLEKLVKKPWAVDGLNFSDRLWTNKSKLINTLHQELMRMMLTGETPDKAVKNVKKAMDSSQFNAMRVVQTEQAYFTSLAQIDSYKELDVEEFEVVATLDGITCNKCGSRDGEHYPISVMEAGVNSPPFHPLCRCTTCPYFDDMDGYRASRNEKGKTVFNVSSKTTYKEWLKEQGVDDVQAR